MLCSCMLSVVAQCTILTHCVFCAMAHIAGMPSPEGELEHIQQRDFVRLERAYGKTTLVHLLTGERRDLEKEARHLALAAVSIMD